MLTNVSNASSTSPLAQSVDAPPVSTPVTTSPVVATLSSVGQVDGDLTLTSAATASSAKTDASEVFSSKLTTNEQQLNWAAATTDLSTEAKEMIMSHPWLQQAQKLSDEQFQQLLCCVSDVKYWISSHPGYAVEQLRSVVNSYVLERVEPYDRKILEQVFKLCITSAQIPNPELLLNDIDACVQEFKLLNQQQVEGSATHLKPRLEALCKKLIDCNYILGQALKNLQHTNPEAAPLFKASCLSLKALDYCSRVMLVDKILSDEFSPLLTSNGDMVRKEVNIKIDVKLLAPSNLSASLAGHLCWTLGVEDGQIKSSQCKMVGMGFNIDNAPVPVQWVLNAIQERIGALFRTKTRTYPSVAEFLQDRAGKFADAMLYVSNGEKGGITARLKNAQASNGIHCNDAGQKWERQRPMFEQNFQQRQILQPGQGFASMPRHHQWTPTVSRTTGAGLLQGKKLTHLQAGKTKSKTETTKTVELLPALLQEPTLIHTAEYPEIFRFSVPAGVMDEKAHQWQGSDALKWLRQQELEGRKLLSVIKDSAAESPQSQAAQLALDTIRATLQAAIRENYTEAQWVNQLASEQASLNAALALDPTRAHDKMMKTGRSLRQEIVDRADQRNLIVLHDRSPQAIADLHLEEANFNVSLMKALEYNHVLLENAWREIAAPNSPDFMAKLTQDIKPLFSKPSGFSAAQVAMLSELPLTQSSKNTSIVKPLLLLDDKLPATMVYRVNQHAEQSNASIDLVLKSDQTAELSNVLSSSAAALKITNKVKQSAADMLKIDLEQVVLTPDDIVAAWKNHGEARELCLHFSQVRDKFVPIYARRMNSSATALSLSNLLLLGSADGATFDANGVKFSANGVNFNANGVNVNVDGDVGKGQVRVESEHLYSYSMDYLKNNYMQSGLPFLIAHRSEAQQLLAGLVQTPPASSLEVELRAMDLMLKQTEQQKADKTEHALILDVRKTAQDWVDSVADQKEGQWVKAQTAMTNLFSAVRPLEQQRLNAEFKPKMMKK